MVKKRTSLDSLFTTNATRNETQKTETQNKRETTVAPAEKTKVKVPRKQTDEISPIKSAKFKGEIVKQTVYLPSAVHEQLRQLAFEERKKMHDYLVEGLDRVFKNRGLKPYVELSDETK